MKDKKRKRSDISIGIIVNQDGEIIDEYIQDEDKPKTPFIKPPENAEKKRRPN